MLTQEDAIASFFPVNSPLVVMVEKAVVTEIKAISMENEYSCLVVMEIKDAA